MKLLIAIIAIYAIAFSFLSVRNHELYQTFGWDLGFFDQLLWQSSRGNLNFVSTIGNINLIGDHFQPILYLLVPLYWLWDDVRVILVAQTILVASAAIPIYLLAKKKLAVNSHSGANDPPAIAFGDSRWRAGRILPFLIATGFLLFHGTQFTLTNEFHQSAFIPLLLSLGLYWIETGREKSGMLALFSLLAVREEMGLLLAALGILYVFKFRKGPTLTSAFRRDKYVGVGPLLTIGGLIGFFLLIKVVIPVVSSQSRYIHYGYGAMGDQPERVFTSVLSRPFEAVKLLVSPSIKLVQVRNAIMAFGGVPLLSPVSLIPIFEQYAIRFIDTRNVHRWLDINHYAAPLGPLLAFATIQAFGRVRRASSIVPMILIIGIIGTNLLVHAPIFALTKSQLYFTPQWVKDANKLVASVPKDAAVAANNSLFPHLSHRDKIYLLPDIRDAEVVVFDLANGPNKYSPILYEDAVKLYEKLLLSGWCETIKQGDTLMLVRCDEGVQ